VDEQGSWKTALKAREVLYASLYAAGLNVRLLGPAEAGVFKVNGRCRYKLTVLAPADAGLRRSAAAALRTLKNDRTLSDYYIYIDVNPNEI
jgi:primosomal protein N'